MARSVFHRPAAAAPPSRLAGVLTHVALGLFAVSSLLAPAALREADASPCGAIAYPHRPQRACTIITHLCVDFLNDDVELPAAWDKHDGAVRRGETAAFKVYAVTDDDRFYEDVTSWVKSIRFRAHGLPGARFRWDWNDGVPRWAYQPTQRLVGKTGVIEVSFRCKSPGVTYKTNFILTVLPHDQQGGDR